MSSLANSLLSILEIVLRYRNGIWLIAQWQSYCSVCRRSQVWSLVSPGKAGKDSCWKSCKAAVSQCWENWARWDTGLISVRQLPMFLYFCFIHRRGSWNHYRYFPPAIYVSAATEKHNLANCCQLHLYLRHCWYLYFGPGRPEIKSLCSH